jgi:hypothetical protein
MAPPPGRRVAVNSSSSGPDPRVLLRAKSQALARAGDRRPKAPIPIPDGVAPLIIHAAAQQDTEDLYELLRLSTAP